MGNVYRVISESYPSTELAERTGHDSARAGIEFYDYRLARGWEYGLSPVEGVLKVSVNRVDGTAAGARDFSAVVDAAGSQQGPVVRIPTVSSSPYYHWAGELKKGTLVLESWEREITAVGLETAGGVDGLPGISNRQSWETSPVHAVEMCFSAILLVAAAVLVLWRRKQFMKFGLWRKQQIDYHSYPLRPAGILFFTAAVILALLAYPVKRFELSPYGENAGTIPYQETIDYIEGNGGVAIWGLSDLDSKREFSLGDFLGSVGSRIPLMFLHLPVTAAAAPYDEVLTQTKGYTAFSPERPTSPSLAAGGAWDAVLMEYCSGGRDRPAWVVADFNSIAGRWENRVNALESVFLLDGLSRDEVMKSLRNGRLYVQGQDAGMAMTLEEFGVVSGDAATGSGGTVCRVEGALLRAVVGVGRMGSLPVSAKIIRNGKIEKKLVGVLPLEIDYTVAEPGGGEKDYYRLVVGGAENDLLFTNPVFVENCGSE
ncbi:MAG TPA: hypothetical protein PLN69_12535 [bacterium]|nr:hypothetical protein [bacterium]